MCVSVRNFKMVFWTVFVCGLLLLSLPYIILAKNIISYSDKISDSGPSEYANHTLSFTLTAPVPPGGRIEFIPPLGFSVMNPTTTFSERNVELWVNGNPRVSSITAEAWTDGVEIIPGSPGLIRYNLAPYRGINSGSRLELRIGSHTSTAVGRYDTYSTSTGTTTYMGDVEPIQNSDVLGRHNVRLQVFGSNLIAEKDFVIFLNQKVNVPSADTTETIPPYRFNPAPTSTVGGTTLSVEISLETDEFAICRFDTVPGTDFYAMSNVFSNTGLIFHTHVVPVTPSSLNRFYVRCIDDEFNFNIDDFIIEFSVNDMPTGQANTDGDVSGDGTGTGNAGTGDGSGAGGQTGDSSGEMPFQGGSDGTGGTGGGGGGGTGVERGSTAGGGFKTDNLYPSGDGRVIISGYAYPMSKVSILVDGKLYTNLTTDRTGEYSVTLDEIARGVYTFGVYGEDPAGVKSSTFSTSFTVTGARTSELTNINIAPSIQVSPNPVDPGKTLTASGYALPNAVVEIENGPINTKIPSKFSTVSDSQGKWSASIDTTGFSVGTYQIRARSNQNRVGGAKTNFSNYTFYGVGKRADVPINADLNRDGKVNLIDFSILLYWWNSDGGNSNPSADINGDKKVNLTDFSILLFNWTG
jgi:hypothetical protein